MKRLVRIAALLGTYPATVLMALMSPMILMALMTLTVLTPLPALANPVPVPTNCTVMPQDTFEHPRVVGVPATGSGLQAAVMTVTVMDSSGTPIPNAHVQMTFGSSCMGLCLCPTAVLEGYTNASGVVELVMALGGCCQDPAAATLLVMGMPIRTYDTVTSPDLASATGGGDCRVVLQDFSAMGGCLGSAAGGCCDFTGDETATLADFVVFGGTWGRSCP